MPAEEAEKVGREAGQVATGAAVNFNHGLRAYYFALGMLAWFVSPLAFMAATLLVVGVLVRRQYRSESAQAIASGS
jgi:uncharacterized membrane protein